jgi:phage shock protein A
MKKLAALLLLAGTLAFAQAPQPKEPTIDELKLQLAQAQVQIAQLKIQLAQAQMQIVQYNGQQAQADLQAAQKSVQDATPAPVVKPSEPKK